MDLKDYIKNLIKKIKQEQTTLVKYIEEEKQYGCFEDCSEFYKNQTLIQKTRVDVLVEMKISLEKFLKLMKYQQPMEK